MALPTIVFNSSTGSDTVASGAGPSTALTGAGASLSASTSIDLSADSPNLSGVATDGSAVLYVNTSSGRQYFKITNVNNSTKIVTVANAATPTESGKTWAIGGKRATFNATSSRLLFSADVLPGWIIENDGPTQSITASALTCGISGDTTDGPIIVRGASGQDHPIVTQSADAAIFSFNSINNWQFQNLQLTNSNSTRSATYGSVLRGTGYLFRDIIFGDATNKLLSAINRGGGTVNVSLIDCEIKNTTGDGINVNNAAFFLTAIGCYVHNCTGNGIEIADSANIANCIITGNSYGIVLAATPDTGIIQITGNTIYNNTNDGLYTNVVSPDLIVMNNIFANNGAYGWNAATGQGTFGYCDFNNYYLNTSGARNNVTAGTNDLAVNPQFNNAAGIDFSLGTYTLRAYGFPSSSRFIGANKSATKSYVDIGAVQRQEPALKMMVVRR